MTKVENQMSKECRRPKHEIGFVISASSLFRHSSFLIRTGRFLTYTCHAPAHRRPVFSP